MALRHFNTTGLCTPAQDYMVDISAKIKQIRAMVDAGEYFTINRARQYGKTTTLQALKTHLKADYIVSRISFEGVGGTFFSDEAHFCTGFDELFDDIVHHLENNKELQIFMRIYETDFRCCSVKIWQVTVLPAACHISYLICFSILHVCFFVSAS